MKTDAPKKFNRPDLLKSIVQLVESQVKLSNEADELQVRKDYCENVKDQDGMTEVENKVHDLMQRGGTIAMRQFMLMSMFVNRNNNIDFRQN